MITWFNKNRTLNIGDTRMVYCTLSESCSKNKLGYQQFISDLEFEVIDNKNRVFKRIDIDKQKLLINKLIQALDEPQLWFAEHLTQEQHDELMLLQISCSQKMFLEVKSEESEIKSEESEIMKPYFDKFYEIAINYFYEDIQEAMNIIYDEYVKEKFIAREINDDIEEALYYSSLDKMAFNGVLL